MLRSTITSLDKTIIIVDELDECEDEAQRAICNLVKELASHPTTSVKVVVMCRKEEKLLKYFKNFFQVHVDAASTSIDISVYIASAVQSSIDTGDMTCKNAQLKDEIVTTLTEKADGM